MPTIDIRIVREGDVPPCNVNRNKVTHLPDSVWYVAILENGMTSGAPSISLMLDLPDNEVLIAETSLSSLIGVAAARGAFPEEFARGPFDESGKGRG